MQLKMPLSIELWVKKKKKYSISMNTYRNLHYQVSNNLKIAYKNIVKDQLSLYPKIKLDTPITLTFIFYNWTKHLSDLENHCSIHNKFFQDSLVELWYIDDDNYNFINKITYVYGGYRKNEWCVEILVS